MDKVVVKLKRLTSSYETDQGEQHGKVYWPVSEHCLPRNVRTVGLPETYCRTTMETASLAWLLCQCIQSAPSTKRKFLKTLLQVKGVDQT